MHLQERAVAEVKVTLFQIWEFWVALIFGGFLTATFFLIFEILP